PNGQLPRRRFHKFHRLRHSRTPVLVRAPAPARSAMTESIATDASLEQFGYRQELKRSLGLFDLVVYGLIGTNILAALTSFGIVFNSSHGMVPLVYVVVVVAMCFTSRRSGLRGVVRG